MDVFGTLNLVAGLVVFIGLPVLLYWIYTRKPGRRRNNERVLDDE